MVNQGPLQQSFHKSCPTWGETQFIKIKNGEFTMELHGFLHDYNLYNIHMSSKKVILSFSECFTETPKLYNIHLIDVQYFYCSELKEGNIILDIEIFELKNITQDDFDKIFVKETDGVKIRFGVYSGKYIFYLYSSYGCTIKAIVQKIFTTVVDAGDEKFCNRLE